MVLEYSTDPDAYNFYYKTPTDDASTYDGMGISASVFYTAAFWTGTMKFDSAIWDFNRVVAEGYPRLAGVGGQ
jgi:hypothetical protein